MSVLSVVTLAAPIGRCMLRRVTSPGIPPLAGLTEDTIAALAFGAASLDEVLKRALDSLQCVVPYDLAAILELDCDQLRVRTALGRLADERVRRRSEARRVGTERSTP